MEIIFEVIGELLSGVLELIIPTKDPSKSIYNKIKFKVYFAFSIITLIFIIYLLLTTTIEKYWLFLFIAIILGFCFVLIFGSLIAAIIARIMARKKD